MSPANLHVGKSEQYDVEKSNNHSAGNGHCLPSDNDDKSMMTTTKKEKELRYGCFGFLPDRLQWLNNIRFAVLFISLAHCFQNTANGLLGVSLSTMEKRFDLSSSQSSWIASAYEIGQIPTIIVISYFGNRLHRPLSMALGLLSVSLGCIVFFIPQFSSPHYDPQSRETAEFDGLCRPFNSNGTTAVSCDAQAGDKSQESLSYYLPMFIIGRMLIGIGATPIVSLGVTFMDDCCTKERFATYSGIYSAMSIVGPGIGILAGGLMLSVFVDFHVINDLDINKNDPRWIGNWWLPYIVVACLSLLDSVPMFGYPADLPGASEIRKNKVSEAHNNTIDDADGSLRSSKKESNFVVLCRSVFTNPTFLLLTVFNGCDLFIIVGFTAFGPKMFEYAFSMSVTTAGLVFGVVLLPAGAIGTILGGVLISKLRLSCRQIIRIEAILSALVALSTLLLFLRCNPIEFAGVNDEYAININATSHKSESPSFHLIDTCNLNCGCEDATYRPICSHDNIQYFSACHAGCSSYVKQPTGITEFFNCSCISSTNSSLIAQGSSNVCSRNTCVGAIVFLVVFFFSVGSMFVCLTMTMSATLRCVASSQKSFAIGFQILFAKIFGTIPGPILFGMAFDASCNLWLKNRCDPASGGSCAMYENTALVRNIFFICIAVKIVGTTAVMLAGIIYKPPKAAAAADASLMMDDIMVTRKEIEPLTQKGNEETEHRLPAAVGEDTKNLAQQSNIYSPNGLQSNTELQSATKLQSATDMQSTIVDSTNLDKSTVNNVANGYHNKVV